MRMFREHDILTQICDGRAVGSIRASDSKHRGTGRFLGFVLDRSAELGAPRSKDLTGNVPLSVAGKPNGYIKGGISVRTKGRDGCIRCRWRPGWVGSGNRSAPKRIVGHIGGWLRTAD